MALRRLVVVGASLAGLRAVEAARRLGFDGELVLIGAERHPPYDRPPLSKQVLQGRVPPDRVFFRRREGFDALGLDLRLGVRATSLDATAREVLLADGSRVGYDALLVATGAAPRTLPESAGLAGVHTLRTLDDALGLASALEEGRRVVVVGAGFIGLEVAASCRELGREVTVVEPLAQPLGRVLGAAMAQKVLALHHDAGVRVLTGVGVGAVEGRGRAERVRLSDGRLLDADLVVVGIGVRACSEWLAEVRGSDAGLDSPQGIACDAQGATAIDGVYAAGDVACWEEPRTGRRRRVEHWTSATEQANAAVERILAGPGRGEPLRSVPYFWSDQHGVKVQFAGSAEAHDECCVVEEDAAARRLAVLYGKRGRVVAALAFGRPAWLMRARALIGEGASLAEARASQQG